MNGNTCSHEYSYDDGLTRWCSDCGIIMEIWLKNEGWIPGELGHSYFETEDGYVER